MFSILLWSFLFASLALAQFQRGQTWQIILTGTPDVSKNPLQPTDAPVWDIDLFDTDSSTIKALKSSGKTVICYFSAGTVEDWRDDVKEFPAADVGKVLPEWPNEKWIRTGSAAIRAIMAKRINLASQKGCDAIDPDNVDGYQNDNGLNLSSMDATDYLKWMQQEAAKYSMKIGLKNALDIVDSLSSTVDFAVNEQCAQLSECDRYTKFLALNKPVFHIEYPNPLNPAQANTTLCTGSGTNGMSTVLKNLALDGPTVYCDGRQIDTPTKGGSGPGRPTTKPTTVRPPPTRPPTTSRPSPTKTTSKRPTPTTSRPPTTTSRPTTSRPITTSKPTTITQPPTRTTSTTTQRPPTTTNNPGGGCKQKHWDQCGGNDWKGCTVCESPYTCKGVSPPWYYQCL